jgi:hypothetical protein
VGTRQQGRERARNVIDAPADATAIRTALGRALDPAFRQGLVGMVNPYGEGTAARTIASVLALVSLERILMKEPVPVECIAETAHEEQP